MAERPAALVTSQSASGEADGNGSGVDVELAAFAPHVCFVNRDAALWTTARWTGGTS